VVNQLSRAQFAKLPELIPIVEHLMKFEANADFYLDDVERSFNFGSLSNEVGVDRSFYIAVRSFRMFMARNKVLDECFPFVFGESGVAGQMDFAFSAYGT
jgi:hypothetical protein